MLMSRRVHLLGLGSALAGCATVTRAEKQAGTLRLIAHRGGVVGPTAIENSIAAIDAAIARAYWMVEVDIRRSLDGEAVLHHDADCVRFYGEPRAVEAMSWSEIQNLRHPPTGARPLSLEELVAHAGGRIRFMLDVKGDPHPEHFFEKIAATVAAHGPLADSLVIGTPQYRAWMRGKAPVGADLARLQGLPRDQSKDFFLFQAGAITDLEAVRWAQDQDVLVAPWINHFTYKDRVDESAVAGDVARLQKLGVHTFQIDTGYERHFERRGLSPA